MEHITEMPVFVLHLKIDNREPMNRLREHFAAIERYLKDKMGDKFITIVIPRYDDPTTAQIFYPSGMAKEDYKELLKELAKISSFKNLIIKLE